VISQKSYLLQAYRNEQLTTERCSCFSVARVSYNYNKDPEPQFNSFASMCSKVPGCVKKASLKDVIDKQKQQAKSSNGSKSSKNGTKKKGSKKSKKAKKASKKAKKASKKKHVPKSFSSQREIPVPPKKIKKNKLHAHDNNKIKLEKPPKVIISDVKKENKSKKSINKSKWQRTQKKIY